MRKVREITNKIYDAVDAGELNWQQVAEGALRYMSEDDVAQMAHNEEFFLYEDEEDDEPTLDELTEQARCSVEELIDEIRSTDPDDLGAHIWQVAYDAVISEGGEDSQARIIAGYMRTQF